MKWKGKLNIKNRKNKIGGDTKYCHYMKIVGGESCVHPFFTIVDTQDCNKRDYKRVMDYLSKYFNVSKLSLKYRLEGLGY